MLFFVLLLLLFLYSKYSAQYCILNYCQSVNQTNSLCFSHR